VVDTEDKKAIVVNTEDKKAIVVNTEDRKATVVNREDKKATVAKILINTKKRTCSRVCKAPTIRCRLDYTVSHLLLKFAPCRLVHMYNPQILKNDT
jgi:hypothetical protein